MISLEKITIKIGYPDKWKDYSKLTITPLNQGGSYFENNRNLSIWNRLRANIEDVIAWKINGLVPP